MIAITTSNSIKVNPVAEDSVRRSFNTAAFRGRVALVVNRFIVSTQLFATADLQAINSAAKEHEWLTAAATTPRQSYST